MMEAMPGCERSGYSERGATKDLPKHRPQLFVFSEEASLQEGNAAGNFAHVGARLKLGVSGSHSFRHLGKSRGEFQRLLRGQTIHGKKIPTILLHLRDFEKPGRIALTRQESAVRVQPVQTGFKCIAPPHPRTVLRIDARATPSHGSQPR
jgi:hypothetical protein